MEADKQEVTVSKQLQNKVINLQVVFELGQKTNKMGIQIGSDQATKVSVNHLLQEITLRKKLDHQSLISMLTPFKYSDDIKEAIGEQFQEPSENNSYVGASRWKQDLFDMKKKQQSLEKESANQNAFISAKKAAIQQQKKNFQEQNGNTDILREKIHKKREAIESMLTQIQPQLNAALANIQGITKRDLTMLQSFAQPPKLVLMAMRPVYYLIQNDPKLLPKNSNEVVSWLEIRKFMNSSFLNRIIQFRVDNTSKKILDFVRREFFESQQWKLDQIRMASTAAYDLGNWAESLVTYAQISAKIEPEKMELAELVRELESPEVQSRNFMKRIEEQEDKLRVKQEEIKILLEKMLNIKEQMALTGAKLRESLKSLEVNFLNAIEERLAERKPEQV